MISSDLAGTSSENSSLTRENISDVFPTPAVDEKRLDEKGLDEESLDEKSLDEKSLDEESLDEGNENEESLDEKILDERLVERETFNTYGHRPAGFEPLSLHCLVPSWSYR